MTLVKSSDWNEASASWFPMAIIQEVKLRATLLGHNCVEMAGMWKSNGNIFFILKRYTWLCIALEYDNKSVFDYSFSFFPQISRYWLPDGWRTSVNLNIWNIMHILFKWGKTCNAVEHLKLCQLHCFLTRQIWGFLSIYKLQHAAMAIWTSTGQPGNYFWRTRFIPISALTSLPRELNCKGLKY